MHTRAAFGELLQDRMDLDGIEKFRREGMGQGGDSEGYLCYFEILRRSHTY